VAVLATGHQMVRSTEGAVLINMSRMNAVHIEPARRLARVEGGTRWQQVLDEADRYGLAPLSGTSPTVGVVGYCLGGGASPVLGGTYGYAADHVLVIKIVTADGELRRVIADSEPDLYWALRGGKGNFGVVCALEFALFPVKALLWRRLFLCGRTRGKGAARLAELGGRPAGGDEFFDRLSAPAGAAPGPEPLRGIFVVSLDSPRCGQRRRRSAF
jgi:FAD/FMN-containing dehydrogenase